MHVFKLKIKSMKVLSGRKVSIDEMDENVCQVCQALFDEEDEDKQVWIGCDSDCGRWYYYWSAGFKRMPSKRTRFICLTCQNE